MGCTKPRPSVEEHSPYDRDRLIDFYNNHNSQICDYVKHQREKLPVLNNAEAWARDKLCEFLEIENQWGPEMPSINSKTIAPNSVLKLATGPAERKMLSAVIVLVADFQQSDVEAAGGTTSATATGKDKAELERRTLIEELNQAGYG